MHIVMSFFFYVTVAYFYLAKFRYLSVFTDLISQNREKNYYPKEPIVGDRFQNVGDSFLKASI